MGLKLWLEGSISKGVTSGGLGSGDTREWIMASGGLELVGRVRLGAWYFKILFKARQPKGADR